MSKTVTLRISEEHYNRLKAYARADNRKLSNAVETLAMKQLDEELFVEPAEMREILSDKQLLGGLKTARGQARKLRGRFVE